MNHIQEFKQKWKPNLQNAQDHVKLTIKNYSSMDTLVFHKQLDVTLRGLIVAGLTPDDGLIILCNELLKGGFETYAWINGRTTSEIISSN